MNKSKKTRQNLKNRKKWLLPVLLALFVLGTALPAFAVRADETEDELLVVEVIEDIPADERVMIEDQQVPLAGNVTPAPKPESPGRNLIPGIILILAAVFLAVREYRRAGVIRLRRNGYREEAERLSGRTGRTEK